MRGPLLQGPREDGDEVAEGSRSRQAPPSSVVKGRQQGSRAHHYFKVRASVGTERRTSGVFHADLPRPWVDGGSPRCRETGRRGDGSRRDH